MLANLAPQVFGDMDHGFRARHQRSQRRLVGEIARNPSHTIAWRLRPASQRAQRQALRGGLIEQGLADEAGAPGHGDCHNRTSWSR